MAAAGDHEEPAAVTVAVRDCARGAVGQWLTTGLARRRAHLEEWASTTPCHDPPRPDGDGQQQQQQQLTLALRRLAAALAADVVDVVTRALFANSASPTTAAAVGDPAVVVDVRELASPPSSCDVDDLRALSVTVAVAVQEAVLTRILAGVAPAAISIESNSGAHAASATQAEALVGSEYQERPQRPEPVDVVVEDDVDAAGGGTRRAPDEDAPALLAPDLPPRPSTAQQRVARSVTAGAFVSGVVQDAIVRIRPALPEVPSARDREEAPEAHESPPLVALEAAPSSSLPPLRRLRSPRIDDVVDTGAPPPRSPLDASALGAVKPPRVAGVTSTLARRQPTKPRRVPRGARSGPGDSPSLRKSDADQAIKDRDADDALSSVAGDAVSRPTTTTTLSPIDRAKRVYRPKPQQTHPPNAGSKHHGPVSYDADHDDNSDDTDVDNDDRGTRRRPNTHQASSSLPGESLRPLRETPKLPPPPRKQNKPTRMAVVDRPDRLGLLTKPKKRSGFCQQCIFEGRPCKIADCLKHQLLV